MVKQKSYYILPLLLISFIVRIWIFAGVKNKVQYFDYYIFREWAKKSYSVGFRNVYSVHSGGNIIDVNQMPGTVYIVRISYEAYLVTAKVLTHIIHLPVGSTAWINDTLLIFFLRMPSVIADLLLGYCIYVLVKLKKINEMIALASSSLFLFCPPVIYNSAVWGQMDSINTLFFILTLFFFIRKQTFLSVLSYALSLYIKPTFAPFLPLYLLISLNGGFISQRNFFRSVIATSFLIVIFSLPFSLNPLWIFSVLGKTYHGIHQEISVNAYNFWWLIFNPKSHISPPSAYSTFLGIPLQLWAYAIFIIFNIPIYVNTLRRMKQNKLNHIAIISIACITMFAGFLYLPKMHERYLYPILPLLIIWVGLKNKFWIMPVVLSLIHFLNLYIVWNPDLFLFGSREKILIGRPSTWVYSFIMILIYIWYYYEIFIVEKGSRLSKRDTNLSKMSI